MHELSITQDIVALVDERAAGKRVLRVCLEIGKISAIMPDAIAFCFDLCCRGTALEGARLEIREIPGRGRCRDCGRELELEQPFGLCTCGSHDLEITAGNGMRVKEMGVA